jgi:hypothetical protein
MGRLVAGESVVRLPEHFGLVTDPQGLTAHLTPRGAWLRLFIVELAVDRLVVRDADGQDGQFDYLVHGVRAGLSDFEPVRKKVAEAEPSQEGRRGVSVVQGSGARPA